jgi:hypothetical protein
VRALGKILTLQGEDMAIVAVGGAASILHELVSSTTQEIDSIAVQRNPAATRPTMIEPPELSPFQRAKAG